MLPCASVAGAHVERLRRALGIPAVLVLAHPLHAHRTADRARQNDGVGAGVFMGVLPVAAGAFEVNQPDLFRRQIEALGEDGAEQMRRLGTGPDREPVRLPVGDGAGWAHRRVSLIRVVEAR